MAKKCPFTFLKTLLVLLLQNKTCFLWKWIVCCFCNLVWLSAIIAQDTLLHIPVQATNFQLDKMGNIYAITRQNDILKYNPLGEKQFEYSENRLGDLTVVDVNNPLEILLYYPDFQVLKIIDRTLSEIQIIELSPLNIFQIPTLCSSSDGNIWLFDTDNQQLLKINRTGRILFQSKDLRTHFQQNLNPVQLQEIDNQIYCQDANIGIIQFDAFGNYRQTLDYPNLIQFQIVGKQCFFVGKENPQVINVVDLDIGTRTIIPISMPFQKAIYSRGDWFLLQQNGISKQ